MRTVNTYLVVFVAFGALAASGCDTKPSPVNRPAGWRSVEVIGVDPGDPVEQAGVTGLEKARLNYLYRLDVLGEYYQQIGYIDKYNWTRAEHKNITEAQWFSWQGVPDIQMPPGEDVRNASEQLLAERLVVARNNYLAALNEMSSYYQRKGESYKLRVIKRVQDRIDPIDMYMYVLPAEIPSPDLKPRDIIPAADVLFERALVLHLQAKPLPGVTDYPKQREALQLFRRLIHKYPTSLKIPLAAYYIGDIYKEYFRENIRAVKWYQRAVEWDPKLYKPARFNAAAVYDLRLKDTENAIYWYKQVLEHERFNESNVNWAENRLRDLQKLKQQQGE